MKGLLSFIWEVMVCISGEYFLPKLEKNYAAPDFKVISLDYRHLRPSVYNHSTV